MIAIRIAARPSGAMLLSDPCSTLLRSGSNGVNVANLLNGDLPSPIDSPQRRSFAILENNTMAPAEYTDEVTQRSGQLGRAGTESGTCAGPLESSSAALL